MNYRSRPVIIEAFRYGHDDWPEWFKPKTTLLASVFIETLEGTMEGRIGDWIIKGLLGELYPCKHEVFIQKYEAIDAKQEEGE